MTTRGPSTSLLLAACLSLMQSLLKCEPALAQPSRDVSSRDSRNWRVQVEIVSNAALDEFEAVLREWFQINSIEADIRRARNLDAHDVLSIVPDRELLRVWVTFPGKGQATIYFVEPGSQRFLLRDVPLRTEFNELAREQLVQVIVTSADAFMQRRAGTSKEDFTRALHSLPNSQIVGAPAGTKPVASPHTSTTTIQTMLRLGGSYQVAVESSRALAHGPGIVLGLVQHRTDYRIYLDVAGQYLLPHTIHAGDIDLRLRGLTLRGNLGIEHRWTEILASGLQIGAGGNHMSFEPLSVAGTGVEAQAESSHWRPALALDLKGIAEVGSTRVALLVGGTAYLTRTQYLVVSGGVTHLAYEPYSAEPHAALELTWN